MDNAAQLKMVTGMVATGMLPNALVRIHAKSDTVAQTVEHLKDLGNSVKLVNVITLDFEDKHAELAAILAQHKETRAATNEVIVVDLCSFFLHKHWANNSANWRIDEFLTNDGAGMIMFVPRSIAPNIRIMNRVFVIQD